MITVRKASERGLSRTDWLESHHTFSFGDYADASHMGFGRLRVINDDTVAPGRGFGTHPHRDMEILSYVLDGALEHKDSTGTGSVIRPGDVQRMTAGTGVTHSEFNHSKTAPVHFLQIWILPEQARLAPSYEERRFPAAERANTLRVVAAPPQGAARDGAVVVHQDVSLYASLLDAGASVSHPLAPGRHAWVQVARGAVDLGGQRLSAGDGAALSGEAEVAL